MFQFRKLVIRATRCQVFVHAFDLNLSPSDKIIGDDYDKKKSIFILAYQNGSMMEDKIRRICNSFTPDVFDLKVESLNTDIQGLVQHKMKLKDIIRQTK
jgi:hypothetical protein